MPLESAMTKKKSHISSDSMKAVEEAEPPFSSEGGEVKVDIGMLYQAWTGSAALMKDNATALDRNYEAMEMVLADNKQTRDDNEETRRVARATRRSVLTLTLVGLVIQTAIAGTLLTRFLEAEANVAETLKQQTAIMNQTNAASVRVEKLAEKMTGQAEATNHAQAQTLEAMMTVATKEFEGSNRTEAQAAALAAKVEVAEVQAKIATKPETKAKAKKKAEEGREELRKLGPVAVDF